MNIHTRDRLIHCVKEIRFILTCCVLSEEQKLLVRALYVYLDNLEVEINKLIGLPNITEHAT